MIAVNNRNRLPIIGVDPNALANVKLANKLLSITDEVKRELQNAATDQIRIHSSSIYFRRLLKEAQSQFRTEETLGYTVRYLDIPYAQRDSLCRAATTLLWQHSDILRSIEDLLELAESQRKAGPSGHSVGLLTQFWSFVKRLQKHEADEHELIATVEASKAVPERPKSHRLTIAERV